MAKTKTTININGKNYTILSDESGEYVTRVGYYVDEKMRELNREYVGLSTNMLTTLAALNIADELLKARDTMKEAVDEVKKLKEAIRDLRIQNQVSANGTSTGRNASAAAVENAKLKDMIIRLEKENELLRESKNNNVKPIGNGYQQR